MSKTTDEYFRDWFHGPFGFCYGSGETSVLYELKALVELLHWNEAGDNYTYDHKELEDSLGEATAWLLINALCKDGMIDYGTSPRFGWFYGHGKNLIEYLKSHTVDEMYETVANYDSDYNMCFDDYCSCTDTQVHHKCKNNPFWEHRSA
jgi:hypothetical protein